MDIHSPSFLVGNAVLLSLFGFALIKAYPGEPREKELEEERKRKEREKNTRYTLEQSSAQDCIGWSCLSYCGDSQLSSLTVILWQPDLSPVTVFQVGSLFVVTVQIDSLCMLLKLVSNHSNPRFELLSALQDPLIDC
eukprot:g19699.t1